MTQGSRQEVRQERMDRNRLFGSEIHCSVLDSLIRKCSSGGGCLAEFQITNGGAPTRGKGGCLPRTPFSFPSLCVPASDSLAILVEVSLQRLRARKTDGTTIPSLDRQSWVWFFFSSSKTQLKNDLPNIFSQKICCQASPRPSQPHKSLIKENENVNFGKPVYVKVPFQKCAHQTAWPLQPFLWEPGGPGC